MLVNLGESIPLSKILAPLRAETDDDALNRLIAVLADALEIDGISEVLDRLLTEPMMRAALIGHGTAIIHSRLDGLSGSVAALGIAPPETSFRIGSGFRYLVRVIFLVLSPPEPPEQHLELVAAIARFVRNQQKLDELKASTSPEQAEKALAAGS